MYKAEVSPSDVAISSPCPTGFFSNTMPQTPDALAFLDRVLALPKGPGQSLNDVLQPFLNDEADLRRLFATDKTNARLSDIHVGLVDVFDAPQDIRTTRARVIDNDGDPAAEYVMPLHTDRRRKEGESAIVQTLDEFNKNWEIFTEGSLFHLDDWNNVVAAGGSVLACLTPLPDSAKTSKRALRKYFHTEAYPSSDIDLFLYGLSPQQAEAKINKIYQAVLESIPWDCTCVRSKHTVSIQSQYPYRSIQIVLRLYQSPAEVLAGFDVDAPCCAYDGNRIWANPRAIVAMMRQCNTVDVTRRSPSYEVRLSKYASRGFEVYVPGLRRADIDPTIYERSISRIHGLARLLALEKLRDVDSRNAYLHRRRDLRSRPKHPKSNWPAIFGGYKGDLKSDVSPSTLQMNDYDVGTLHIPYGPGWNAGKIEKLIYQTDLGMNSPYNPRNTNRRLHKHPAWFGTITECLGDLCGHCPEPFNDEERALQKEEDRVYIRGRVRFIQEDPGRQSMTGSFNPIDIGEWSEDAYIGDVARFFKAITSFDRVAVLQMIHDGTVDVNRRDHAGRTPLHIAVLVKAVEIACDLIDLGARITSRLADGRTALHVAARLDLPTVIRKLVEMSAANAEKAKEENMTNENVDKVENHVAAARNNVDHDDDEQDSSEDDYDERGSSEDDWSLIRRNPKKTKADVRSEGARDNSVLPEDTDGAPDVLDINLADWDLSWPPLFHAIANQSLSAIEELLAAGADAKSPSTAISEYEIRSFHPLALAILAPDDDRACEIIERLLKAGATSMATEGNLRPIFHRFVSSGRLPLLSALLRADPNSKVAVNFPAVIDGIAVFPLVVALSDEWHSVVATLLAHGAKVNYTEEDLYLLRNSGRRLRLDEDYLKSITRPIETAIAHRDPIATLLVKLGTDISLPVRQGLLYTWASGRGITYLEWIRIAIQNLDDRLYRLRCEAMGSKCGDHFVADSWKSYHSNLVNEIQEAKKRSGTEFPPVLMHPIEPFPEAEASDYKKYLEEMEELFVAHAAKGRELPSTISDHRLAKMKLPSAESESCSPYHYVRPGPSKWENVKIAEHAKAAYDELFQACWDGDDARIQQLCIPRDRTRGPSDPPLQISVHMVWQELPFTTLHFAVRKRRWSTIRLIMAIAASQCKSDEAISTPGSPNIVLNDFDKESESGEDNAQGQRREIDYIDIASRPSAIHSHFSAQQLLDEFQASWPAKDGSKVHTGSLLQQAIAEDDFDAFVHIYELYKLFPAETYMSLRQVLHWIILYDRPRMLDEFIRWTGVGIELPFQGAGDGVKEQYELFSPGRKVYLGLTVHGKKRKDLATRRPPLTRQNDNQTLVMKAAMLGANDVLVYLHDQRPLIAYKHFASTNSDNPRSRLQEIVDLPAVLPQLLGWTTNVLNESPLTAALVGNKLETVKLLFALSPELMSAALHARIKFCHFTALLAAVDRGCSPDLFDYLLSLKAPVTDVDHREWNIYHLVSARGHTELLTHMLGSLPKDSTTMLLNQQSKSNLNTPLHLAVKAKNLEAVKLLVAHSYSALTLRDVNGFTPLYSAVSSRLADVTEILCRVSPKETLYMENNVGDTIPETAVQLDMYTCVHRCFPGDIGYIAELDYRGQPGRLLIEETVEEREQDVNELRNTLNQLLAQGHLVEGTTLASQLLDFTSRAELLVAQDKTNAQPKQEAAQKDPDTVVDGTQKIAEHIRAFAAAAVAADPDLKRNLCHILDVHRSVERHLNKGNDGLAVEDSELQRSLLYEKDSPHFAFGTDMN